MRSARPEPRERVTPNRSSNSLNSGRKETVVVGGSAAGLYTAALVARGGCPVRVLEAAESLEAEPRTLIVTRHLRDSLGRVADACTVNEIRRFELFTDGRSATVALARPDLIIERAKLIRGLAEEAQGAGAVVECGQRFLSIAGGARDLTLAVDRQGKKEELRAATVVGAD